MKYVLVIGFLISFLCSNDFKGVFFQAIEFEYQYIENNNYYKNGEIFDMYADSITLKNQNNLGLNYLIRSRTGYSFWIFSAFIEYVFNINKDNQYNVFSSKVDAQSNSFNLHEIIPVVYVHYDPWGLNFGMSYLKRINEDKVINQAWSLKPSDSISFFFSFYWPQFWNIPIGVSAKYELAIKPTLAILDELYHQGSFGFHINFSYYSQFQLLYTIVNSQKDQTITRIINDSLLENFFLDETNRYYVDFIFIFQITENFSLKLSMGQLLYSEYESLMMRFNIGLNYVLPVH